MDKRTDIYEAKLCAETVDTVSEKIRGFLTKCRLPKRDILRYAMTAEEILLKTAESTQGEHSVRLITKDRFFRRTVTLELDGACCNVFAAQEDEQGILGSSILRSLGVYPEYSYAGETNRYLFHIKERTINPFLTLFIALGSALLVGALGYLLSDGARSAVTEYVLTPLNDAFLNILACIAGPTVFLSVCFGIYGMGDAATLKRIGKKLLLCYTGAVFAAVIVFGWACLPLFDLDFSGSANGSGGLSAVVDMLLGMIPTDIFSPFVNGNTLQIIFLAVLVGIAMLVLGQRTEFIAKVVEQINYIVQYLIEGISKLVPFFIFIVLVKMIWGNTLSTLSGIGKLFAVFLGAAVVHAVGVVLISSLKNRANPALLVKKGLPTLIIAMSTASSAAAFGTNIKVCRKEYGIDDKLSSFGIPLGIVIFKPDLALSYTVMSLFFAEVYGLGISAVWMVVMMLTAGILALATPPIPGGALTAYTVLFAQLGIPAEALVAALACDALFDFVSTGFDQFLMPLVLLNQADRLGMTDREKLLRHKK